MHKKKLPDKPYLNVCVRGPKDTDHIRDLIHAVHQVAVELQKICDNNNNDNNNDDNDRDSDNTKNNDADADADADDNDNDNDNDC